MYDPKFRFALLLSILVVVAVILQVTFAYIIGDKGLNIDHYVRGVPQVASAIFGGFAFVWISTKLITLERLKRTGFEASTTDETGTKFNFMVSLNKFLPEIVAPPFRNDLHPLEAELIGFLNGYRYWPMDVDGKTNETLYQHSLSLWEAMYSLPNTSPLHRIAALGKNLGKVYEFQEVRKIPPYLYFWRREQVSFKRRCNSHGGYAAFILSTMPSFRQLSPDPSMNQRYRRALLTALRAGDDPQSMPANCDPLAKELYEFLHLAGREAAKRKGIDIEKFNPSEAEIQKFKKTVYSFFQAILREADFNPAAFNADSEGIYLGDGKVVMRIAAMVKRYTNVMTPDVRNSYNLWSLDEQKHPSWAHFIATLNDHNLLLEEWDTVPAKDNLFDLRINGISLANCLIFNLDKKEYPDLLNKLDSLPSWNGLVEVEQQRETLLDEVKRKVASVNRMIENLDAFIIPNTNNTART